MRLNRFLGLALLLAIANTSALGFQESNPPAASQAAPVAPVNPDAALAPGSTVPPAANETEVRIPGLGRLGVLPKMDFGLELLYGASEPKPAEEEQAPADDLTIRGTIKHPF